MSVAQHAAKCLSVLSLVVGGQYYFYYAVGPQDVKPSRIGVAVSAMPERPFVDSGKVLLAGARDKFEAIDPMVFADSNDGRVYLYAGGSNGSKLRIFELNADLVSIKCEVETKTPPQFTEGAMVGGKIGRCAVWARVCLSSFW